MEYLIGVGVALAVAGLAAGVGFDRDSFGSTVLIVTASYYVLFATMADSARPLVIESVIASAFLLVAVLAFKSNPWLVPAGMAAHGVFDIFHGSLIHNSGMPVWWPGFCLAFDAIFGGWVAVVLLRRSRPALSGASHQSRDARS